MLRLLGGGLLRVVGLIAGVTLVLLQFAMPLFVGGGALRMGGLRGGVTSRVAAPRAPARRCSFSASTAVVLADGTTRPIADVRIGDRVLAADPMTGDRGVRSVTHVWRHEDVLVDLETSDGAVVSTTQDHPFWNATDHQWQPAIALDPGDRLLTTTGTLVTVDGLDLTTADAGVAYNLTVDDLHTYYVGIGDHTALVHNDLTCWFDAGIPTTKHFRQQMAERRINPKHALETYMTGKLYYDPKNQSYIRHNPETQLSVVVTEPTNGTPKSAFRGPIKTHWEARRWKPPRADKPPPAPKQGKRRRN